VSHTTTVAVVKSRLDTVTRRVRWFDAQGKAIVIKNEEPYEAEGSQIKDAIVRWLEEKK
jgi:hypothetical protein